MKSLETRLTRHLGFPLPIIQAPMAGGSDTPELVAAVSTAGGMGFIGAAYLSPHQIVQAARAVRDQTDRPFGINLFAPTPVRSASDAEVHAALERVAPFYTELGLEPPTPPAPPASNFDGQLEAVLESGAAVFSFTFNRLPAATIARIKAAGLFVMGTATTVDEAIALEHDGVDAVIAQGGEAGGHRATFLDPYPAKSPAVTTISPQMFQAATIGTMALVPQIVDSVHVPVVASGGIMDGRGLAAALVLGASAVQMGTAFIACEESGASAVYRQAILHAKETDTTLTQAFSGRSARGIRNRFMAEVEDPDKPPAVLPFPLQNALTRPLRTAGSKQGRPEFLSLWAGQGLRMAKWQSAADLVHAIARQAQAALERE
jgi:nitronate monooxygenase